MTPFWEVNERGLVARGAFAGVQVVSWNVELIEPPHAQGLADLLNANPCLSRIFVAAHGGLVVDPKAG